MCFLLPEPRDGGLSWLGGPPSNACDANKTPQNKEPPPHVISETETYLFKEGGNDDDDNDDRTVYVPEIADDPTLPWWKRRERSRPRSSSWRRSLRKLSR